ncbi:hypothetical protein CBQ26_13290 [Deinococcus indicus]|uniref:Uncharacterized protein n=1 Tax=Deinococcus indicus TaxID=223556 RepID=A0A246BIG7_9DEIO|nr:hypothetical protein [Deinococcus indicus]OWL95023.1 hypothetical protein CBQ26_13290 [Deinococcus indicus]
MLNDKPVNVTVEGWLHYQLLSEGGLILKEGEQHNLILNSGLDYYAAYGIRGSVDVAHVGTGSTAPAVTQTGLAAPLATTRQIGVSYPRTTRTAEGVYNYVLEREFGFQEANGNLTEWGYGPNGAGNLSVRELFRDANGNPIVISKDSTQKLRLTYTLQITVGPTARTAGAVTIDGVGTRTGSYHLCGVGDHAGDLQIVDMIMVAQMPSGMFGGLQNGMTLQGGAEWRTSDYNLWRHLDGGTYTSPNAGSSPAYVAGSYTRQGQTYSWDTSQYNGAVVAVTILCATDYYNRHAWVWSFDPGQEFVKSDLDRLTLRGPSVTWGRA